jgi:hypothetical protein
MFAGACVGARLGDEGIPQDWLQKTTRSQEIIALAKQIADLRQKL